MPLPDPHAICAELEVDLNLLALAADFPGGLTISLPVIGLPARDHVARLLAQVNAALAPLMPFFKLLDVVLSIVLFAKAVPGVLTSPGAVIDAIEQLLKKVAALARLLPQIAIPFLLRSLLTILISYVSALRNELDEIVAIDVAIAAARQRAAAAGSASLLITAACAEVNRDARMSAVNAGMEPLNRLLTCINLISELIGAAGVPLFASVGNDPNVADSLLEPLQKTLTSLRDSLPSDQLG